jgi:hypothetical protein
MRSAKRRIMEGRVEQKTRKEQSKNQIPSERASGSKRKQGVRDSKSEGRMKKEEPD